MRVSNAFVAWGKKIAVVAIVAAVIVPITNVLGAQNPTVSVSDYSQCANDDGDGYATGDTGCRWTNGNLQANNSTYHEADATVQRALLEDVTIGTTHTITFKYGTTKGAKHAYDYLTDDNFSELAPNALTSADLCDGTASSKLPSCSSITPSVSSTIPTDPNAGGFDAAQAARHFKIRNGTITAISTPTITSGSYAGDSETSITVSFTVPNNCVDKYTVGNDNIPVCAAMITFGAHISRGNDWGIGTTAVNIPGSPYHVALDQIDGTSIGQRDNQMQAGAIILPSTVTVHKVTDPATDTTTSFPFVTTGTGYSSFNLNGGGQNAQSLNPGTYTVAESNPLPNYALSNLVCTATGSGSSATPNLATRTTTIVIGAGGGATVDCTYTNTLQQAHLTLIKNVINDNGGTADASAWTLAAAGATPISGVSGSAAVTSAAINPGSYALTESGGPSGYTAGTYSCVINGNPAIVSSTVIVAPSDITVCTVTNDDQPGTLIVKKVVVNDNGGTKVAGDFSFVVNGGSAVGFEADGQNDTTVNAGTYTVVEPASVGYATSYDNCANLVIPNGGSATCTITNDDIKPKLTITKIVVNDNGGNAVVSDFPLYVGLTSVTSGTQNSFNAASYTVSETNLPGYTAGNWTGDCAADGSITLSAGDVKACTITNDDQPAHIKLIKSVINDNGGTAGVNDFGLTIGGADVNSGDTLDVNSNTATALNEAGLAGYAFVSLTGDASCPAVLGGTVTLDEGQTISCTITNNDISGTLSIVKNTVGGDGTFDFNASGPTVYKPSITTASGTGTAGPVNVNAGTYAVNETIPTGWDLSSASCDDGTSVFSGNNISNVSIALGQHVVCTFTNTKKPTLTIIKKVNPTTDSGLFNLAINGTTYATDVGNNGSTQAQYAVIGSNSFAEAAGTGTNLNDYFSSVSGTGCGGSATAGTITLAAGDNKTCTITNTKKSHLIVQKTTLPAGDSTSFAITATGTGTITGGGSGSVTDATDYTYETTAGTYSVAETVPSGWDKTGDTCQNVVLAAGQTATCLLTNTKRGSITIVKDAQPNDLTDFAFSGTLGNFPLDDDQGVADSGLNGDIDQPQSKIVTNLVPGVFTVTETEPNSFWTLNSATCVTASGAVYAHAALSGNTLTITLDPGAAVTCTFVNKKQSPSRTQGFWQNHTSFTSGVFATYFAGGMQIGSGTHKGLITNIQSPEQSQLFGAYFSNIAKLSSGKTQRTATDKARMVLLQQLVTAKLNCAAFGCASSIQSLIASADSAYASGNTAGMTSATSALDAYNNSGDTITISNAGSATPNTSKSLANLAFWDTP